MQEENQIPEDENNDDLPELDVRQENEFKKIKMNLELGAVFPEELSKELPPEIEGAFLDSIINFEKAFKNSKRITINQKLNCPHFIPESVLNDAEIDIEIDKLLYLLNQHNIQFETLAQDEYDNREIYKFLSEDFQDVEIDDVTVPNMISFFTYEDYRPNHRYSLQREAQDFIKFFVAEDTVSLQQFTFDNKKVHGKILAERQQFERLELHELHQKNITYNDEVATISFDITFDGYINITQNFNFSGNLNIDFKFESGYWYISNVDFPFESNQFFKQ